jgi:hypothetical protein
MADIEKDISSANLSTKEEPVNDEDIYIDPVAERKLLWKCDMFLTSLLTLAFLSAYLDRSNIGNAAIAGLLPDLNMNRQQLASKLQPNQQRKITLTLGRCCAPILRDLYPLRTAGLSSRQKDPTQQTATNLRVSHIPAILMRNRTNTTVAWAGA